MPECLPVHCHQWGPMPLFCEKCKHKHLTVLFWNPQHICYQWKHTNWRNGSSHRHTLHDQLCHLLTSKTFQNFDVHVTVHCVKFLIKKPTRCTNFSNLFLEWNTTRFGQFLRPSSGVFHCTHSNGICRAGFLTACEQDQDVPSWSCSQAVSKPVWHIPLLCVQWKTPDDGHRNCPKHVEFHFKNKLEKLVHLVGFITRNVSRFTVTWTSNMCLYKLQRPKPTVWYFQKHFHHGPQYSRTLKVKSVSFYDITHTQRVVINERTPTEFTGATLTTQP
jgi:hypothetical protein